MDLPVLPMIEPMLAKAQAKVAPEHGRATTRFRRRDHTPRRSGRSAGVIATTRPKPMPALELWRAAGR